MLWANAKRQNKLTALTGKGVKMLLLVRREIFSLNKWRENCVFSRLRLRLLQYFLASSLFLAEFTIALSL